MWEKIKNFFKWIADHTGISWIARKISSGWKWLFGGKASATQQSTSQQEKSSGNERQETHSQSKDNTLPKAPSDELILGTPNQTPPPGKPKELVVDKHEKAGEPGLEKDDLTLWLEQSVKIENYKDSQSTSPGGLLMYIKCGENEYRITGTNNDNLPNAICVKSILKKSKDGKYVNGNIVLVEDGIENVKKMLGLSDGVTKIKVDSISNSPFEAPTLEQPKLNTTTTQQVVNNDSNREVAAEEHASSSTTTGLTEQLSEVNSTQELSTPNNEPVKIDTSDQPTPPGKPKELVVDKHEKVGELELKKDELALWFEQSMEIENYKGRFSPGLLLYLRCDKGEYRITGSGNNYGSFAEFVLVKSILKKNEDGNYTDSNTMFVEDGIENVKKMLGLSDGVTTIKVDSISHEPFKAPTLGQPNSNDNIFNQQSAGPGGLFQSNDKEPQPT